MNERKYYIDWLRVFAMIGVFVYHCTRFFDTEGWHLKAPIAQQGEVMPIARHLLLWVWLLELFFFVAGYATWYALRRRTGGQYLAERARRILVPLYTIGLFVLLVPQVYFERFTNAGLTATFWEWLPGYFRGLPAEMVSGINLAGPLHLYPHNFMGHLWFLGVLFLICLVSLPVFLYLRSGQGQRVIDTLARWSAKPGGILLFVIPLAAARIGLYWMPFTADPPWADFVWYALFFIFGYVIAADERFTEGIRKSGWLCLGLWLGLFTVVSGVLVGALEANINPGEGFSPAYLVYQGMSALASWSAVVFLVSMGAKYLNFTNKFLAYSNEAVMPFYIFHQTVILIAGWFVLPLAMSAWAKFLVITLVSFPVIMLLYEGLVRHIPFMRFLFGMAPLKKEAAAPVRVVPAAK